MTIRDSHTGPWAWLTGYTCTAHRIAATDPLCEAEALHCACRPSLPLRIAVRLGLTLELAPTPEPRWCSHTWPVDNAPGEAHLCELQHDHGSPEHVCDCGARRITNRASDRLLRMLRNPTEYDQCLWPEDTPCPLHDKRQPWPAGRDCLGTCTNCNAQRNEWHTPSCIHYTSPDLPIQPRKATP